MKIGCIATEGYYADHLASIWLSLPKGRRGPFFVAGKALSSALSRGIPRKCILILPEGSRKVKANFLSKNHTGPVLSASFANWRIVTTSGLPNPTIPHGQGGKGPSNDLWVANKDRVDLMLVPTTYGILPELNCQVIHGQPKLDRWYGFKPANERPVLAISFRWRETHSAFNHYRPFLKEIKKQADRAGVQLLGHGHPLRWHEFSKEWQRLGIESNPSFDYVLSCADVYAADCSSTSFEFVGLDRPVIFLWDPKYSNLETAPRFTKQTAGITNYDPLELVQDTLRAYEDPPEIQVARRAIKDEMFEGFQGQASANAARILENFYD